LSKLAVANYATTEKLECLYRLFESAARRKVRKGFLKKRNCYVRPFLYVIQTGRTAKVSFFPTIIFCAPWVSVIYKELTNQARGDTRLTDM
jgi:hypothetical protein